GVAGLVAEPGDGGGGPVRVGLIGHDTRCRRVAKDNLSLPFEPIDHVGSGKVVPFAVRNRDPEHLPFPASTGERRVNLLDTNMHVLTPELETAVPEHRPWQQSGFEQDLKTVADARDRAARGGK